MVNKKISIKLKVVSIKEIIDNYSIFIENSIPIWRRNKLGRMVTVPLIKLKKYFDSEKIKGIKLYIDENWHNRIKSELNFTKKNNNQAISNDNEIKDEFEVKDEFEANLMKYREMSFDEREEEFDNAVINLKKKEQEIKEINSESINDIAVAAKTACYISKVSLEDNINLGIEVPIEHIDLIVENTSMVVESIVAILKKNETVSDYLNQLEMKSKGSTIDHINNVFLRFISFCKYYNWFFFKGEIAYIRSVFENNFYKYYSKLLPDVKNVTLETVFKGGMREIYSNEFQDYSLGVFLHDIGKLSNIDYFESDSNYNRDIITKHVPVSYNMIINADGFGGRIPLLTALHHEYYNHPSGYGLGKKIFQQDNKKKSQHYENCITYDADDLKSGNVLAYFPAKVLEIIDVYDALIDKGRRYRNNKYTIEDALTIMREEFIDKYLKIDPILFTIFVNFVKENAELSDVSVIEKLIA